jgi:hypothetical protein
MIKDMLMKSGGMGSSTPQEGGTTDEEYYGQPEPMPNKELKPIAKRKNRIYYDKPQQACPDFRIGVKVTFTFISLESI